MKIALLAGLVSMNVRLKRLLKATFIKLMLKFAPIAAHVLMYARLRQFILHNKGHFQ